MRYRACMPILAPFISAFLLLSLVSEAVESFSNTFPVMAGASETIDKRRERRGEYAVMFCSRPSPNNTGFPGHAFIIISRYPESGIGPEEILADGGFYPENESGKEYLWKHVPGAIKSEFARAEIDKGHCRLRVRVDEKDKLAVERLIAKWHNDLTYKLTARNCVNFVDEVAKAIGLKTTASRLEALPAGYVWSLLSENRGVAILPIR